MSFWGKFGWWSSKHRRNGAAKRIYIVDTKHWMSSNGSKKSPTPRNQIDYLRDLARFVRKEKLECFSVLEGQPLRKVSDGGDFNGVTVYYAKQGTMFSEVIMKLLKKHISKYEVTVITTDIKLEKQVWDCGGQTFRSSTFGKALDSMAGVNNDRNKRLPRNRGGRRPVLTAKPRQEQKFQKPQDSVSELIDIV
ncbi:MAG: hypothetical protein GKR87_14045 [Kiritimatiellae bacterium]|nr:hypothetical protein [Kiritimatiellia bacterium]